MLFQQLQVLFVVVGEQWDVGVEQLWNDVDDYFVEQFGCQVIIGEVVVVGQLDLLVVLFVEVCEVFLGCVMV